MAAASIIGSAVGMLLLIIVAYVIVNSVIYSADVVTTAQNSATSLNEVRLNTHMSLNKTLIGLQPEGLHFSVTNDGNEIIYRLDQMQVYTWDGELANYYTYYNPSVPGNYWDATTVEGTYHPNHLNPGEDMTVTVLGLTSIPTKFQITTNNGITAQITCTSIDPLKC